MMRAPVGALIFACVAGLALVPSAPAVTVTVGRADLTVEGDHNMGPNITSLFAATRFTSPGSLSAVPADGRVVRWRAVGRACGTMTGIAFAVLRPDGGGRMTLLGRGPWFQGTLTGTPMSLAAPIAVRAGDRIGWYATEYGIDCGEGAEAHIRTTTQTGSVVAQTDQHPLPGQSAAFMEHANREALINADVVLDPPVVDVVSPAAGPPGGGQTVSIRGAHLSPADRVSFGGVPARSFAAVSSSELRAVTPAHAAGTVPVSVTTPGGLSSTGRYSFVDLTRPVVSEIALTQRRFRAAKAEPGVSAAVVGTTIRYRLSEDASTSLQVQRPRRGYRVGRRCRAKPPGTRTRRRCTRWVNVRRPLTHAGRAGPNRLRFRGRVQGRSLRPGRYRLRVVARDAARNASRPRTPRFRIVR